MATLVSNIYASDVLALDPVSHSLPDEIDIQYYREQARQGPLLLAKTVSEFGSSVDSVAAWKRVTDAVHESHSTIYLKLRALDHAPQGVTRNAIKDSVGQLSRAAANASAAGFDGIDFSVF